MLHRPGWLSPQRVPRRKSDRPRQPSKPVPRTQLSVGYNHARISVTKGTVNLGNGAAVGQVLPAPTDTLLQGHRAGRGTEQGAPTGGCLGTDRGGARQTAALEPRTAGPSVAPGALQPGWHALVRVPGARGRCWLARVCSAVPYLWLDHCRFRANAAVKSGSRFGQNAGERVPGFRTRTDRRAACNGRQGRPLPRSRRREQSHTWPGRGGVTHLDWRVPCAQHGSCAQDPNAALGRQGAQRSSTALACACGVTLRLTRLLPAGVSRSRTAATGHSGSGVS